MDTGKYIFKQRGCFPSLINPRLEIHGIAALGNALPSFWRINYTGR